MTVVALFQEELRPEVVVLLTDEFEKHTPERLCCKHCGKHWPMTPQMAEDNLMSMAELAKANGIRVLLCSILPAGEVRWHPGVDPTSKVIALNTWMKVYASKEGFTYVDYWTTMATPTEP